MSYRGDKAVDYRPQAIGHRSRLESLGLPSFGRLQLVYEQAMTRLAVSIVVSPKTLTPPRIHDFSLSLFCRD